MVFAHIEGSMTFGWTVQIRAGGGGIASETLVMTFISLEPVPLSAHRFNNLEFVVIVIKPVRYGRPSFKCLLFNSGIPIPGKYSNH